MTFCRPLQHELPHIPSVHGQEPEDTVLPAGTVTAYLGKLWGLMLTKLSLRVVKIG